MKKKSDDLERAFWYARNQIAHSRINRMSAAGRGKTDLRPDEFYRFVVVNSSGKMITKTEVITTTEIKNSKGHFIHVSIDDSRKEVRSMPPINAEYVLHLFLRRDEREALIGDLIERYVEKCDRFGKRRADFWFYMEVGRSLWPLLKRVVGRVSGLMALCEWIRRHVS